MEGLVVLGCILILLAAFTLAVSMNIQQFALTGDEKHWAFKLFMRCKRKTELAPRTALWCAGLFVYLIAQLLVLASVTMTPFALVSTLFATCLFFDDLIAYFVLGKRFSVFEIVGVAVIVGSLGLSASYSPSTAYDVFPKASFAPNGTHGFISSGPWAMETIVHPNGQSYNVTRNATIPYIVMTEALSEPSSIIVIIVLLGVIITGWLLVRRFEKKYPNFPEDKTGVSNREYRVMQIVYPLILGTVETFGASSLKALSGMIKGAGSEGFVAYPFWLAFGCWIIAILNTVSWLRFVYQKYPTSECLPVEIAMTAVFSVYVGLYVYQESDFASKTDISVMTTCTVGIISGIALIVVGGAKKSKSLTDSDAADPAPDETSPGPEKERAVEEPAAPGSKFDDTSRLGQLSKYSLETPVKKAEVEKRLEIC